MVIDLSEIASNNPTLAKPGNETRAFWRSVGKPTRAWRSDPDVRLLDQGLAVPDDVIVMRHAGMQHTCWRQLSARR